MVRHAAAVVFVLCANPAWLCAQDVVFTVKAPSATIHLSPSTGSQIVGRAPRGTVLEVTNELGSWVKVSWPDARDGAGFVHTSMGTVARSAPANRAGAARPVAARPSSGTPPAPASGGQTAAVPHTRSAVYVAPPAHLFGVGGMMGGATLGYGATARAWSRNGLGVQLELSRHAVTSATIPGRVTSIQFAPSVLYSLPDHMTDYFRVRPYVGAGTTFQRQSFSDPTMAGGLSVSDSGLGFQAFAGGEVTFAHAPRLALSVDAGYQESPAPFAGFEPGRFSVAVSAHWYIR